MNTSCGLDAWQLNVLATTRGCVALLSYVVCAAAIVTAVGFYKAHKVFYQRLVLYLLTAALILTGTRVVQTVVIYEMIQEELCVVLGFLLEYTPWVRLMFTCWITFYLFMLTVCNYNPNTCKHEAAYVISSLLVPLPIACVPFITHTYGLAGAWCWIKATDADCSKLEAGVIEQFTLWYGPLFVLSILEILGITVITCILCKRAWSYDRENRDPLLPRQNQRAVLTEVLPLIAYPIIFHTLCWIPLADRLQTAVQSRLFALGLAQAIASPTLGMIASTTLLIHLQVLRKHRRENVHAPSFTECEVSHEK